MICEREKLTLPNPAMCRIETETIAWHPYPDWKPPRGGKYLVTQLRWSDTYQEDITEVAVCRYSKFTRSIRGFFGATGKVIAWAYMPEGVAVPPEECE